MKENPKTKEEYEKEEFLENIERKHWSTILKSIGTDWRVYVMMLPMIFFFICWRYIPMSGLLIAFKQFNGVDVVKSDWYGLSAFQQIMFGEDSLNFWKAFRNTFVLAFYGLVFGFPFPIILALFFSEIKNALYRSTLQILTYLPKFVSLVVMTTIVTLLFRASNATENISGGPLTALFEACHFIKPGTDLMRTSSAFRPIYVVSGLWEGAGYGSIVYFAAILSISPTSYEAARMDGASKLAQIKYVVLPGIASTLTIMLILDIGKLLTIGYEKVMLLYDATTYETADVVSTYVMRKAGMAGGGNTSSNMLKTIASAADLFNSIIAMLLVIGSNLISRKVSDTSLY